VAWIKEGGMVGYAECRGVQNSMFMVKRKRGRIKKKKRGSNIDGAPKQKLGKKKPRSQGGKQNIHHLESYP